MNKTEVIKVLEDLIYLMDDSSQVTISSANKPVFLYALQVLKNLEEEKIKRIVDANMIQQSNWKLKELDVRDVTKAILTELLPEG